VTFKNKECRVEQSAHSVTEYTIGSIVFATCTWHGLLSQHVPFTDAALLSRCVCVCARAHACVCVPEWKHSLCVQHYIRDTAHIFQISFLKLC